MSRGAAGKKILGLKGAPLKESQLIIQNLPTSAMLVEKRVSPNFSPPLIPAI